MAVKSLPWTRWWGGIRGGTSGCVVAVTETGEDTVEAEVLGDRGAVLVGRFDGRVVFTDLAALRAEPD